MDQKVTEIRNEQWRRIVYECLNRDPNTSKRQWCDDNGIRLRSLMYWQHKFRLEALAQAGSNEPALPARTGETCVPVFADVTEKLEQLQADQEYRKHPDSLTMAPELMIQTGSYQIYVNGSIQMTTLEKVMRIISRA